MPEIEKGHTLTPTRAMKERGEAMASSFEHYCRERWQFARNYANKEHQLRYIRYGLPEGGLLSTDTIGQSFNCDIVGLHYVREAPVLLLGLQQLPGPSLGPAVPAPVW